MILTDREIKGIRVKEKSWKKALRYKVVDEIKEQDYVIHENFGVGIFLGLENIDGQDYLKIKYADEDKLFVPVDSINKIEKFINISDVIPEIYKLGRKGFKRKKVKLSEDIEIFAKEIIKIQAKRNLGNGFKFSKDTVNARRIWGNFSIYRNTCTIKSYWRCKKRYGVWKSYG